jgi:hypothetical protein
MKLTTDNNFAVAPCRTQRTSHRSGIMLVDCLVYGSVLLILLGVAYAALYRCSENSAMLRRNTEDVTMALKAGERWRADVRAARGLIRSSMADDGTEVVLPCPRDDVSYRFATNSVSRRVGNGGWNSLLPSVASSIMASENRTNLTAWRWELELKPRSKRPVHLRPLFTFIAVPEKGITQ